MKQALKKVVKQQEKEFNNISLEGHYDYKDLPQGGEQYNIDAYAVGFTIDEVNKQGLDSDFFESWLKTIAKNYKDSDLRTKTSCSDNFMNQMENDGLDKSLFDALANFGYGDNVVKYYNVNGFDFWIKVRNAIPMQLDTEIVETYKRDDEGEYLTDSKGQLLPPDQYVLFKQNKVVVPMEKIEKMRDNIIVDIRVPSILNTEKEYEKALEEMGNDT
jgi:hypothetical protein